MTTDTNTPLTIHPDPHSYYRADQFRIVHIEWNVAVDFDERVLHCKAEYTLSGPVTTLDLDMRNLVIQAVSADGNDETKYRLHPSHPVLGSRLTLTAKQPFSHFLIVYKTSPHASALRGSRPSRPGPLSPFSSARARCCTRGRGYPVRTRRACDRASALSCWCPALCEGSSPRPSTSVERRTTLCASSAGR